MLKESPKLKWYIPLWAMVNMIASMLLVTLAMFGWETSAHSENEVWFFMVIFLGSYVATMAIMTPLMYGNNDLLRQDAESNGRI